MVYFDLPPEVVSDWPAQQFLTQTDDLLIGELPSTLLIENSTSEPRDLLDELRQLQELATTAKTIRSENEPSANRTIAQDDLPSLDPAIEEAAPTEEDPSQSDPPNEPIPSAPVPTERSPDTPSLEDAPSTPLPQDRLELELETTDPDETPEEFASRLQLSADYQSYDPETQVITARGNVLLELNDAIIEADELWVNLRNRYTLASGDVLLTRGSQLIRGSRVEYNFIQRAGTVGNAVGTLFFPELANDLSSPLDPRSRSLRRVYDPIDRGTDLEVDSDGSLEVIGESSSETESSGDGQLRQVRFETDSLAFDVEGWVAEDVRITNDPFSPPELELRTDRLTLRNVSATQDELLLKRPRLVFDQGLSIPLFRRRILISRGEDGVEPDDLNPVPVQVGVDSRDRGGLFIGREIPVIESDSFDFSVTPQYSLGQAINSDESDGPFDADNFGGTAEFDAQLSDRTTLEGTADLNSLNLGEITENLRTSIRAEQLVGNHRLALQYSYRERLFNGSLGFQDVQSSFGAVILSPEIFLNDDGLLLTYQGSAQLINAETDRDDLLRASGSDTGRISLARYQASAALSQTFNLWRGQPKPATQDEGLRFSPVPLVPYLDLRVGLRGTGTYYSSGDSQENLIADVGIEGQLGHLSRNFGDYTRYSLSYSQSFIGGAGSPFLFDREVDRNVLTLGLAQQLYGPFIIGFQTAFSLSGGQTIDTIYTLEYSRRTYGILLAYDDAQGTGSIGFRLSNFSWIGDTNPFDTPRVRRVEGGVIERD